METEEQPEGELDGQPGWRRTLYALWMAQFSAIVGFCFVMPFIPFYIRELGVTDERLVPVWAGVLAMATTLTLAVFSPIWGSVADKYGRKLMVIRAMFGGSVVLALMGRVGNVYQLLALCILQGVITGSVAASTTLVSSITPSRRLGYSLGLMQTAMFVGAAVGPFLGGMTADYFGYRVAFYMAGTFLFLGGCVVLWGAHEKFSRPTPEWEETNGTLRQVAHSSGFPTMLAVFFLVNLGATIVAPILPLFVEQLAALPARAASTTGLILAVSGLAAAVTASVVGRVSDRIGHKKVLVACTLSLGIFSIPQALARSVGELLGLRALYGLAAGGTGPTINAIIAKIAPRNTYGKAYGLTFAVSMLGAAIGPLTGGVLASQLGLRAPFVLMGVCLVAVSLVVALRVKEA